MFIFQPANEMPVQAHDSRIWISVFTFQQVQLSLGYATKYVQSM